MSNLIKKTIEFLEKIDKKQTFQISETNPDFSRFLVFFNKMGFLEYEVKNNVCNIKLKNKTIDKILSKMIGEKLNTKKEKINEN